MTKILITGAAGFIGSELAKYLNNIRGYELTLVDNLSYGYIDNLKNHEIFECFIKLDVRSDEFIELALDFDFIFHFAGISSLPECEMNPSEALDVNTQSVTKLLRALRRSKKSTKLIFASTSAVYENSKNHVLTENLDCSPDLVYAQSKYFAESLIESYSQNYGIQAIICRFFNVYGPHQDFRRLHPPFTSYLIKEIISNRTPSVFNQSDARRDYIYIKDLIRYLEILMNDKNFSTVGKVNICSGNSYTVPNIVNEVEQIIGRRIDVNYVEPKEYWSKYDMLFNEANNLNKDRVIQEVNKSAIGDPSKIRQITKHIPEIDLNTGLRHIIEFQKTQND